jgi:hypothetical protein
LRSGDLRIDFDPVVSHLRLDRNTLVSGHNDVRGLIRQVAVDTLLSNLPPFSREQTTTLYFVAGKTS